MDEKNRIKKYEKQKNTKFNYKNHNPGIILIKKTNLENVTVDFDLTLFRKMKCYLYHFRHLGISQENMAHTLEGKRTLIYRMKDPKPLRRKKCPWCYMPVENLEEHIKKAHNKTIKNIHMLDFQKNLYKELLRIVRETPHYMSLAFVNAGCQMCDNPTMEGRELCCSIPTSFRDRSRSLNILGMKAKNLEEKYITKKNMGQIILLP